MKEKKKTKGKEKKKKSAFKKIQDKQKPSENWDFFLKTIVRKKIIEYVWLEGGKCDWVKWQMHQPNLKNRKEI